MTEYCSDFIFLSAFATSLYDLRSHFTEKQSAYHALAKIIDCLQEMNKFHTTLMDQASRTVLSNLTSLVKTDIKAVRTYRQHFLKSSEDLDVALVKHAQANKNRLTEVTQYQNELSATMTLFRHQALDYVNSLITLESKKMPEILWTVSGACIKACMYICVMPFSFVKFCSCTAITMLVIHSITKAMICVTTMNPYLNV